MPWRKEQHPIRTQSEELSCVSVSCPTLEPSLKLLGLHYCWKGSGRDSILAGTTSSFWNPEPIFFKDILTNQPPWGLLWFAGPL